ncbi:hypothetical protein JNO54_06110 [Janibacter sp. YIM B02568]|jgi:hypothetical protein|uniref:hypothetical protein n=1 Tax=Janibacter endophyticus TaxID=2806261 RepID=UPI001951DE26|nr:hypothetical protein [Janibacter endophyticus]MBM6545713.1 hypothetical protein [Janibacter endophyticus]
MEKQIAFIAEQLGAALVPCTAPSARVRCAAAAGNADLYGTATVDDPRPPGHWTVPLR